MAMRDLYTFESRALIRLKSAALRRVYRRRVVGSISVLYNIYTYTYKRVGRRLEISYAQTLLHT